MDIFSYAPATWRSNVNSERKIYSYLMSENVSTEIAFDR